MMVSREKIVVGRGAGRPQGSGDLHVGLAPQVCLLWKSLCLFNLPLSLGRCAQLPSPALEFSHLHPELSSVAVTPSPWRAIHRYVTVTSDFQQKRDPAPISQGCRSEAQPGMTGAPEKGRTRCQPG